MNVRFQSIFITLTACLAVSPYSPGSVAAQTQSVQEIEQLDFANGLFQRGLYDMSVEEYKNYISTFKEGQYLADAHLGLAESLFFNQLYTESIAAYQEYLQKFPSADKAAIAHLRLGQAFFLTQRTDDALGQLEQVNREGLNDGLKQTYDYYLGRTHHKKGNDEKALAALSSSVGFSEQPLFMARAFLTMGDIFLEQGQYDEAVSHYMRAYRQTDDKELKALALSRKGEAFFTAGRYEQAAATFKDIITQFPNQETVNAAAVNLLNAYYNLGQYEQVVNELKDYEDRVTEGERAFEIYDVAASTLMQLSQYDAALAVLEKGLNLVGITPEQNAKLIKKKAEALVQSQRYEEANALMKEQVAQNIDPAEMLFLQAESYYGLAQYDKALAAYQQVINQHPDSPLNDEASWALALTQRAAGQKEEAVKSFLAYFKNGKNDVYRSSALYNAILLEASLEESEQAITHAKTFMDTFPESSNAEKVLYLLGNFYGKTSQHKLAVEAFRKYVEQYPDSPRSNEVLFLLGYNLQGSGDASAALEAYERVQGGGADDGFKYAALKNAAVIYMSQNRTDQAIAAFEELSRQFADNDLNLSTFLWMAEQAISDREFEKALSVLKGKESLASDPKEKAAIFYFRGQALNGMQNYNKAVAEYEKVIAAGQEGEYMAAAHLGMAWSLTALKELDRAERLYQQIVERYPDHPEASLQARFGLGKIEELKGNAKGAVKYYMLVSVLFDDKEYVPEALWKAGDLFEIQGQVQEAGKAYRDLIDRYPDNSLAEQAKVRLNALNEE